MKPINSILLILIFSILISCSDNNNNNNDFYPNLPYFEFKNEDIPNLLNLPELNSILTFINQNNEELYFDVTKSESERQLYSKGNWVTSSTDKLFYYDMQEIYLKPTNIHESYNPIKIILKRWPVELKTNIYPVVISEDSNFKAYLYYRPFNNQDQSININYNNPITSLIVNDRSYDKVLKVDLTNRVIVYNNWPLPSLNYIYFDINEGIIGFDDRNGNEWRLK